MPAAEELKARARSIVAELRGRAGEADTLRRLPKESVALVKKEHLGRTIQPKSCGGYAVSMRAHVDVVSTIGEGCGATAWVYRAEDVRDGGEVATIGALPAFRFDRSRDDWALVVHPLWSKADPLEGLLAEAVAAFSGRHLDLVDTFNLARRPVLVREQLLSSWLGG